MKSGARLRPSAAGRIVACPGSVVMGERYPEEDTIETREGEAVHWGGAQLLRGEQIALGLVADNGVTLTDEMVETAEAYYGHIAERDGLTLGPVDVHVEEMVASAALHVENYGTPDYWNYVAVDRHLFIDDLKNGHGFVNEIRNWQLMNYAALVARELGLYGDDRLKITMTIHQPRSYHRRGPHRSVTVTLGELRKPLAELSLAFRNALEPNAPVIASNPDECMNCSARHECEAAIAAGYVGVDMAYDSTPLIMSPAALSKEYRTLIRAEKIIKARLGGIEQSILSSIQRGKSVPFFAIEHNKGRTVWRDDAVAQGIGDVAQVYGVTVTKPAMITPLQAIKAGLPEDVVKMYSHAPSGAAGLVEIDGNYAASVFK